MNQHQVGISFTNHDAGSHFSYQQFFLAALDKYVHGGRIVFVMPDGTRTVGVRCDDAAEFRVHVANPDVFRKVVCYGNLGLGEAYMAGDFYVEGERLADFLTLLLRNRLDQKLKRDSGFLLHHRSSR